MPLLFCFNKNRIQKINPAYSKNIFFMIEFNTKH